VRGLDRNVHRRERTDAGGGGRDLPHRPVLAGLVVARDTVAAGGDLVLLDQRGAMDRGALRRVRGRMAVGVVLAEVRGIQSGIGTVDAERVVHVLVGDRV